MEHLALYRKWRPQNFKSLIGQEDNVRVLKNAVLRGRTVHAYLFCGTRGTGKTSTARILAKALNCEHPVDGEPCNECEICRGITEGSFMDVIEIDAASNRGIDEVRDLLEKVHFVPVRGKYKVYIIDEAHMLTTEAFNALLKTFEEPPSHVVFILATTEARKIPMTILSRCQRYDFKSINEETLKQALKNIADAEGVEADEDAIALLAEKAKGSMRDALSLMDQAMGSEKIMTAEELNRLTGSVPYEFWPGFFRGIAQNDLPSVFASLDEVERQGKDLRQFFRDFRDCAGDLISGAASGGEGRYRQILKECADLFTPAQILEIITVCGESEIVFRYNRDGKAVCRFLMARIMKSLYPGAAPAVSPAAVTAPAVREAKSPAPAKEYIFPNETIGGSKETMPKKPAEVTPPKGQTEPEDLPPWETMPSLDDLVPPPEEELSVPDLPSFSVLPETVGTVPAEPVKEETPKEPSAEEPPKAAEKEEPSAEPMKEELSEGNGEPAKNPIDDEEAEVFWAKLLKAVRNSNPSTFTWLSHGDFGKLTDTELIVDYDPADRIFLDKVKEPAHTTIIEKEMKKVFGRDLRFRPQSAEVKHTEEMSLF